MHIADAQREMRAHFVGGFYGQGVSGTLWLVSAALATWGSPRAAIIALVIGGMFIFPATLLLLRITGEGRPLSPGNTLPQLGMQVAFVLPLSMPLLLPVGLYKLNWFFPAMMILVGAHYVPFVFLYGMRMFAVLAGMLLGGGVLIGLYASRGFATGAWFTAVVLFAFAVVARIIAIKEMRGWAGA
jgi:hypothetical protein